MHLKYLTTVPLSTEPPWSVSNGRVLASIQFSPAGRGNVSTPVETTTVFQFDDCFTIESSSRPAVFVSSLLTV